MKCFLCGVKIAPDLTYTFSYLFDDKDFCPSCHDDLKAHRYSKRWVKKEISKYGKDEEELWGVDDLLIVNTLSKKARQA